MFVPSNLSNFRLELPRNFIPEDLEQRFLPVLNKMNSGFEKVNDYISATLKNIAFPSLSQEIVSQSKRLPKVTLPAVNKNYRSGQNPNSLFENKEFSISFLSTDGFLNYFILMDAYFWYYNYGRANHYTPDFRLIIMDIHGIETMSVVFREVIFTALEGLTFSYNDTNEGYSEFSVNFKYNIMDLDVKGSVKSSLNQGFIIDDANNIVRN